MVKEKLIMLAHGSGGGATNQLIDKIIRPYLHNEDMGDDAAILELNGKLAFTTDSYVISPLFFPGGDIGRLAVCGTVNDLATAGATPKYLSLSLIIEEGLAISDLEKVLKSIKDSAAEAKVQVVTGDTKVVGKGAVDHLFINTSGIGIIGKKINPSSKKIKTGDKIILSGTLGNHGMTIMSLRHELGFGGKLQSDVAPLNHLVEDALRACPYISAMRDPTRGGLASVLNEMSVSCGCKMVVDEEKIPVDSVVSGACAMLGIDPYYVANEGKMVFFCPSDKAQTVLQAIKNHKYGRQASIIGEVTEKGQGVSVRTSLGALRRLDMVFGELLPRIC